MADFLWPLTAWHWLAFGIILTASEALIPGFILLWFGVGALVTGVALWFEPTMHWHIQLLLFATFSLVTLLMWRMRTRNQPEIDNGLNTRTEQYIGQRYITAEGLQNGVGRITIGDSSWLASGPDCPAGTTVTVVAVLGTTLKVEPAGSQATTE